MGSTQQQATHTETEELRSLLGRIRRRWFAQVALCNVGRAAAAAAVPVCIALSIEYLLAPQGSILLAVAAVTILLSLAGAAAMLRRMQRRPDDRHVARFIEERTAAAPGLDPLDDALVSAVDVAAQPEGGTRPAFAAMILAAGVARLRQLSPAQIVTRRAMRLAAVQAAAGAAVLLAVLLLGGPALSRAIDTARVRYFPESIVVDVLPGDARVAAGSPLSIRAVIRNSAGSITQYPPSLAVSAGGEQRVVRMEPGADGFVFDFDSIDRTFTYKVSAGAAVSREYTVTALFAPRVRQIDLRYTYPTFTGLRPRDEEDGGDIYGPAGTRVRVRIHTDKPVSEGRLALAKSGGTAVPLHRSEDGSLEGELVLRRDDSYRVALADNDGLRSDGDTEYFIRLMDDRPPDVRIMRPSADQGITPLEEVAIEARADDDYGIARFELVYAVGGGEERVVPFDRVGGTDIQKVGTKLLAAEDLRVQPGDVISYYARARDVGRGKRATTAHSDIFFLEVKPFSEEFVQAQSQAGGGAASAQIDSLIAAQKEIISATWNIERRSTRGVSAADLKQVAQAQAELRERVEQMTSRTTRRRPPIPPEVPFRMQPRPLQPRAAGNPMVAVAEAMGRAQQQLDAEKTKEAIPHEMAALNGLLAAQAEVRRREVSRQNGGGSGGGNRSGQDLSALFDRELQRQQRTNYESRSQVEQGPDREEAAGSAADRIRDLARRQEDLSRQQRDFANAGLSQEEMKRQLERLTREQTELRERAEELSRQMARRGEETGQGGREQGKQQGQQQASESSGQQQGQPQQGSGQGSQQGSAGMRGVSEQMRDAASDLRREDARAAADKSDRAAEQLRRLERQMRGDGAASSQKAAGELQLEAQQIAQEQRRIAAEAERLDKASGAVSADARRRLAGEKEQLARRVDELQRSAAGQAKTDPKAAAGGAAEAAKELDRAQIARQMRDSAKDMRASADATAPGPGEAPAPPPAPAAGTEQQIARALDRVVDKLGGDSSADARRLAEQLDQTRGIRDRLDRLEQQIRQAEAQQRGKAAGQQQRRGGDQGRSGAQAGRGGSGEGQAGELQRLQQEYQRELQRSREALDRLSQAAPESPSGGATPEQHEYSRSAPGTDAARQDRSGWEALRKDLDLAMEKYDTAVSGRLAKKLSEDRLSAGGSDRVPESYRRQIGRYFESLARTKK